MPEHVDPFDDEDLHLWVKLEHLGRYLYAADVLQARSAGIHLDLGCATGYGLRELAPFTARAVGLDYDPSLLQTAAEVLQGCSVDLVLADLDLASLKTSLAPTLRGCALDSVTAFEFFEHLDDARQTLRQLTTCLREGSLLLASVPNVRFEANVEPGSHHHKTYGRGEFASLLQESGFVVERVLGQGTINRINRRETWLVRKGAFNVRPSDLAALNGPEIIRKLALLFAYPDEHDLEFSYAHLFVARFRG